MAVVLLALLALALIVAAVRVRKDRAFARDAVHAYGVVTDVRHKRVGPLEDRDLLAYPLVRLTLPDGTTLENWAERPVADAEVGDHVEVLYDAGRIRINRG